MTTELLEKSRVQAFREILAQRAARKKKTLDERYRDAVSCGLVESDSERHERIMADDSAWVRL
jgi:hypothetical protein